MHRVLCARIAESPAPTSCIRLRIKCSGLFCCCLLEFLLLLLINKKWWFFLKKKKKKKKMWMNIAWYIKKEPSPSHRFPNQLSYRHKVSPFWGISPHLPMPSVELTGAILRSVLDRLPGLWPLKASARGDIGDGACRRKAPTQITSSYYLKQKPPKARELCTNHHQHLRTSRTRWGCYCSTYMRKMKSQ